jgi:cell division protein FtsN
MARTLQLALNRVFRSRWGVALVLAVLVLGVVGIGRLFHGAAAEPPLTSASPAPAISANPSDDDTVISAEPAPSPTTFPGAAEPEAVAYAFASAWVDHHVSKQEWHDGIRPNATQRLADELNDVDPASVPADRLIGRPSLVAAGENLVNAIVTTDSGKLTLKLVALDQHWLVDGIDWDPS